MKKPFFYKLNAAEFMAEVFQIPEGKHKEWLSRFALDLVAAEGTTEYTKKLIEEVSEFRKKQALNGAKGGRRKKSKPEAPLSDTKAPLSDTKAEERVALGISRSNSKVHTTIQEEIICKEGEYINSVTGEKLDSPF